MQLHVAYHYMQVVRRGDEEKPCLVSEGFVDSVVDVGRLPQSAADIDQLKKLLAARIGAEPQYITLINWTGLNENKD